MLFFAHEPYLTNDYDPYEKGKITGAWYSLQDWKVGYPNDVITFIEADNLYVKGNKVMTIEDQTEAEKHEWSVNGTFEIDYAKKQIVMVDKDYKEKIYGIFEIDDSGERAKLKIEYQKGSFPSGFSSKALNYIQRSNKGRRIDGYELGVSKSRY
ncbi:hypothetical protein LCGC14_2016350 [marine sediment metagenome]|uniref:Uncharacterized protein n=1 Tax=marine sediment metagenome TaxID=412755 RepID=A0A0F9HC90_9ZZZZ